MQVGRGKGSWSGPARASRTETRRCQSWMVRFGGRVGGGNSEGQQALTGASGDRTALVQREPTEREGHVCSGYPADSAAV